MIKIDACTYLQLFETDPDSDMTLSGWEACCRHFLFIPFIIYTKPLFNNGKK